MKERGANIDAIHDLTGVWQIYAKTDGKVDDSKGTNKPTPLKENAPSALIQSVPLKFVVERVRHLFFLKLYANYQNSNKTKYRI